MAHRHTLGLARRPRGVDDVGHVVVLPVPVESSESSSERTSAQPRSVVTTVSIRPAGASLHNTILGSA